MHKSFHYNFMQKIIRLIFTTKLYAYQHSSANKIFEIFYKDLIIFVTLY